MPSALGLCYLFVAAHLLVQEHHQHGLGYTGLLIFLLAVAHLGLYGVSGERFYLAFPVAHIPYLIGGFLHRYLPVE